MTETVEKLILPEIGCTYREGDEFMTIELIVK
jgi:hypothetical protein